MRVADLKKTSYADPVAVTVGKTKTTAPPALADSDRCTKGVNQAGTYDANVGQQPGCKAVRFNPMVTYAEFATDDVHTIFRPVARHLKPVHSNTGATTTFSPKLPAKKSMPRYRLARRAELTLNAAEAEKLPVAVVVYVPGKFASLTDFFVQIKR